jgi:hypothetical protein
MAVSNKKYLFGIPVALFAVLIIFRHFVPESVNWDVSFSAHKKIPYGCSVINGLLRELFPGQEIFHNTASFYMTLDHYNKSRKNLIIITENFNPDDLDLDAMLEFVGRGNNLFLSSFSFPSKLCDTVGFETHHSVIDTSFLKKVKESLNLNYLPPGSNSIHFYNKRFPDQYFDSIVSGITILGTDRLLRPDFIATGFGRGKIYIHCQPMAFTNYHILYGNYQYACAALSVLPVANTIWDQYYKSDRFINMSPVRFILSNQSLKIAWYIIIFIIIIYFIFGSRRKQRPIPVIKPPENTSLGFIKSIAGLYFKSQNHADIAKKKVMYLREFLRTKYGYKITEASPENILILTEKSGAEPETVDEMLRRAVYVEKSLDIYADELVRINHLIESFYQNCK